MNSEQTVQVFKYSLTGALVLLALLLGNCQSSKFQTRMAIEAGIPPMAARCALEAEEDRNCVLLYSAESRAE